MQFSSHLSLIQSGLDYRLNPRISKVFASLFAFSGCGAKLLALVCLVV